MKLGQKIHPNNILDEFENDAGKIWELYILACLDLFQKASKKSLRLKRLKRSLLVLQKARDAGHVTAPLYARWVDLLSLTGLPEEALDVCCAGLEAHPGETTLWERRLSMMVSLRHDATTVQEALNDAQKHIPKQESWPLVQMVLEHNISCNAANETVKLLEISMIDHAAVSQPAKEFFLEYEYLQHGIAHTRTVYNRLCKYKPLSQQLYRAYISMELAQPKPKMKLVRAAYEEALREHGDQAPDLWLDYIRLESSGLKGKMEKVGQIHFRAVKALQGAHNQEFLRRYTLLQTSEAS
ncbi:hypothetical protein DPMN_036686 [Dreissena polymorpha]|uniref:U3 small nucleolar RNA-associated protein 6 homolog C-terminal domain-containing protein n=1 Tax=Dreissena polymorpha TaxID=45954 RepID=A0A9D4RLP2_DREPO|nr:hypothetical protein DPMN_036686 [Dreissena polymorpha]